MVDKLTINYRGREWMYDCKDGYGDRWIYNKIIIFITVTIEYSIEYDGDLIFGDLNCLTDALDKASDYLDEQEKKEEKKSITCKDCENWRKIINDCVIGAANGIKTCSSFAPSEMKASKVPLKEPSIDNTELSDFSYRLTKLEKRVMRIELSRKEEKEKIELIKRINEVKG